MPRPVTPEEARRLAGAGAAQMVWSYGEYRVYTLDETHAYSYWLYRAGQRVARCTSRDEAIAMANACMKGDA